MAGLSGIASTLPLIEVPFDTDFQLLTFNDAQLQVLGNGSRSVQVPIDITIERFVDDGSFLGIGPIVVDYRIQGTLHATSTSLAPTSPTFESGNFEGWQVIGDAEVAGAFADGPAEGSFQALLRNGPESAPMDEILATIGPVIPSSFPLPESGTLIYRQFELQKGESISFEYNFLSNEPTISNGETNDSVSLFIDSGGDGFGQFGRITPHASSRLHPSSNGFAFESGWKTESGGYRGGESGLITIGFLIGDGTFDPTKHSALLIDNVRVGSVVPEPSTFVLAGIASLIVGVLRHRITTSNSARHERESSSAAAH